MQRQAQEEMMNAIKLGLGTYLSVLVSLYLAAVAAKQFLMAKAVNSDMLPKSKGSSMKRKGPLVLPAECGSSTHFPELVKQSN
jgi:hypothetical protein